MNLMPEETRNRGMSGGSNLEHRAILYSPTSYRQGTVEVPLLEIYSVARLKLLLYPPIGYPL